MRKHLLETVVFLCGAIVMVLELTGSRIVAPFVGTSLPVWTSLIGVVLAALSFGYWWGGKLADKKKDLKTLATLIALAGIWMIAIAFADELILSSLSSIKNIFVAAILAALSLFALPSILLGMVTPFVTRLEITKISTSGKTMGRFYALSTLGSILGTFAAGFFLIPSLGSFKTLLGSGITLLLVSLLTLLSDEGFKLKTNTLKFLIVFIFLASLAGTEKPKRDGVVLDTDTPYSRVIVYDSIDLFSQRPVRYLTNGLGLIQAGVFLDKDEGFTAPYFKYFALSDHFNPNIKKALALGGASYNHPKEFLRTHPDATIDVVEIDPEMTEIAREHFNLRDNPRMSIHHQDARVFLNQNEAKYDVIFVDVFESDGNLPYQLTTLEAVKKMGNSLTENGLVVTNIIRAIEGGQGEFTRAELKTYKEVFPHVLLFQVSPKSANERQNLVLVGMKNKEKPKFTSTNKEYQALLSSLWREPVAEDVAILTDDRAPIGYFANRN